MSLFSLTSSRTVSKEDFADAHEPLNDGVKKVPTAATVAASTKTGDVGKDTNAQGTPRTIPEKPDTDDKTEKQFDTVSESAEKGTAPKAPAAKPDESAKDSDTPASKPAAKEEGSSDDVKDNKAPPFEKKDETPETDAEKPESKLEHETKEATTDELKKTEKATKSLENYTDHAKRFDIVGYPRKDRERLVNMITFIGKRSGKDVSNVTVSSEAIDAAVSLGKARIAKLERDLLIHEERTPSSENYDVVVEEALNETPPESGADLLDPAAAAALTEKEIDPLDLPDDVEFTRVKDAIETLQSGQVAIERYVDILRSNPRISKQAAAVLQAGLEQIDQMCGLRVRATGMEGYTTTPRAAMEDATVNEKSLMDRAGEIGAKIIQWLKDLVTRAGTMWDKMINGISSLQSEMQDVYTELSNLRGASGDGDLDITSLASPYTFMEGEWVGEELTIEEEAALKYVNSFMTRVRQQLASPIAAVVKTGGVGQDTLDEIEEIVGQFEAANKKPEFKLPGGFIVMDYKGKLTYGFNRDRGKYPKSKAVVDLSNSARFKTQFEKIRKFTLNIADSDDIDNFKKANNQVADAILSARRGAKGPDFDEIEFQKIQTAAAQATSKFFDITDYFSAVRGLVVIQQGRCNVYKLIAKKLRQEDARADKDGA